VSIEIKDVRSVEWAAGLFEGEGSFGFHNGYYPVAQLGMTDEDVVRGFHATVGVGAVYGPYEKTNPKWKPCWKWMTTNIHDFHKFAEMIGPFMFSRRSARLAEVLAAPQPKPRKRSRDELGRFAQEEFRYGTRKVSI
jgi:hypothetical protein